jgi:hypothetical protein
LIFQPRAPTGIKELLAFIKAQDHRPKVIAIYTLADERVYAESLGFDAIFPKMFKVNEFLQKAKELLGE